MGLTRRARSGGEMTNKDQWMVKCSAIGFAVTLAKEKLWDSLSDETKKNLKDWLGGMNDKEIPNTNWPWFRVWFLRPGQRVPD